MRVVSFFIAALFIYQTGYDQTRVTKYPKDDFKVGYSQMTLVDSSRLYKPGSLLTDSSHFRPIAIDMWYPANVIQVRGS
jgi:hypothetical protein